MNDLGDLQREVSSALREAMKRDDFAKMAVLSTVADEMIRSFDNWKRRFDQTKRTTKGAEKEPSQQKAGELYFDGRKIDVTGKTIHGYKFEGERVEVGRYNDLLESLAKLLLKKHPENFVEISRRVRGRHVYFSEKRIELRRALELKSGFFVEINLPAQLIVKVCYQLVAAFGHEPSSLMLDVSPFRTRALKASSKVAPLIEDEEVGI